jgi:hypothetical protein
LQISGQGDENPTLESHVPFIQDYNEVIGIGKVRWFYKRAHKQIRANHFPEEFT